MNWCKVYFFTRKKIEHYNMSIIKTLNILFYYFVYTNRSIYILVLVFSG